MRKKVDKKWTMTDSDYFQLRRNIYEHTYEFYAIVQIFIPKNAGDQCYKVARKVIFMSEIDTKSVLISYDYESLEEFIDNFGNGWDAVLAECAFELSAGAEDSILQSPLMTREEAKKLICDLTGYVETVSGE